MKIFMEQVNVICADNFITGIGKAPVNNMKDGILWQKGMNLYK